VLLVGDLPIQSLQGLLQRFGLNLVVQSSDKAITGSFWGDSEAGIVAQDVFVRPDTPVHSLLHETCHTICMDESRRAGLDRDAGGDDLEEAAVCYLQILLADEIEGVGRERLMTDMDAWGYSFRLGNTRAWFKCDAEDATEWLQQHGLIDSAGTPTFTLRGGV
jgi:hypothetical protein